MTVLTGRKNLKPHMDDRNLEDRIRLHNPDYDNYYPLHSNTTLFNGNTREINLMQRSVLLSNHHRAIGSILEQWVRFSPHPFSCGDAKKRLSLHYKLPILDFANG
jgi:hypothetical protein